MKFLKLELNRLHALQAGQYVYINEKNLKNIISIEEGVYSSEKSRYSIINIHINNDYHLYYVNSPPEEIISFINKIDIDY